MTSQYRHRRSSNPSTPFPANIEPGEIAVNTANRQIALGDAASATLGVPKPLLAIRIFDIAAIYAIGDIVMQAGVMYRAVVANGPGAFTAANWGLAAAQIVVSDTPPPNPSNGSLWWESDSGLLYIYYVDPSGPPGQWVIASPQPDFSIYALNSDTVAADNLRVLKAGDTMTGDLTVSKVAPYLVLDRQNTANGNGLQGRVFGSARWTINLGNNIPESGSNVGSDFGVVRYNDAGAPIGYPLVIPRSTGLITIEGDPTAALGVATKQYVDAGDVVGLAASGMQINGGMEVSQENGSTAIATAVSKYVVDGWNISTAGTQTVGAGQSGSVVPPGFSFAVQLYATVANASPPVNNRAAFVNLIEGYRIARLAWGTASAKPITIGFWVFCTTTGLFSGSIRNGTENRSYVFSYTINAASTWEYKTVTILGDTLGTWAKTNALGMELTFVLLAGTDYLTTAGAWIAGNYLGATGTTNLLKNTTDYMAITGVTVLSGALTLTAAQSPLLMRPYDQELLTCMRYYEKLDAIIAGSSAAAGANSHVLWYFKARKRATPTLTFVGSTMTAVFNTGLDFTDVYQTTGNAVVGTSSVADARL